jgi:CTP:molybdopterin cytidylyltransferase MocA
VSSTIFVAAVVLAAGASSRMGTPKALLRWRKEAFVTHVVRGARAAGCNPIVVVQGAVPLPAAVADGARIVHNARWTTGQLSSLQCGLAEALAEACTAVLVLTVDRPHVSPATTTALIEAHRQRPDAVWQPAHGGRSGHPILYPADIAQVMLELDPRSTPREVLGRPAVAKRRAQVDVDDPAVLDNLDRPEDLQRLP